MSNFGSTEFYLEVSKGNIPGHSTMSKFGENPDIDTGSFDSIWDGGGVYSAPSVAQLHDVVSTSASDAGTIQDSGTATGGSATTLIDSTANFIVDGVVAGMFVLNDTDLAFGLITDVPDANTLEMIIGMQSPNFVTGCVNASGDAYRVITGGATGAWWIHIQGIGIDRLELEEFIVMNGLTIVPTVGLYYRQFRARAFGGGGTAGMVGVMTSDGQTDATTTLQIIDGNNQTLMAIYTVPYDKTAYLGAWRAYISKRTATSSVVRLRVGDLNGIGYVAAEPIALNTTGSGSAGVLPIAPFKIPGGADIWVEADASANNTGVSSGFDLILVDN